MKRYDFIINLGMRSIIEKHPHGEYVKYEDVLKVMNKLADLMIKPTKLREEFVIEFMKKTEV